MAYNVPEVRFYYLLTPAVFGSFIYSSYSCFSNNMKLFLLFLVCFVCREPSYCSICASFLNEMLLANGSKAWEIWLLLNLPSSGFKACTEVRTQKFTIFWRWKYCQNKKEKKTNSGMCLVWNVLCNTESTGGIYREVCQEPGARLSQSIYTVRLSYMLYS